MGGGNEKEKAELCGRKNEREWRDTDIAQKVELKDNSEVLGCR